MGYEDALLCKNSKQKWALQFDPSVDRRQHEDAAAADCPLLAFRPLGPIKVHAPSPLLLLPT
jgi:hypothetical protein